MGKVIIDESEEVRVRQKIRLKRCDRSEVKRIKIGHIWKRWSEREQERERDGKRREMKRN